MDYPRRPTSIVSYSIQSLSAAEFPAGLREIPQPPQTLTYLGNLPPADIGLLSVVGSRKYTSYGRDAVEHLISGLRGYPVGIVSGLALGIDSLAHEAALQNDLYTLAIPGGGLDDSVLYPARHRSLAHRILEAGGGLLSEFEPTFKATRWSFVQRNRIVAGISSATLLIEAAEQSGTLTTARMVADYNRELCVVPGSIFSKTSRGVHQFLKLGATPVTEPDDLLYALGLTPTESAPASEAPANLTDTEARVMELLYEPLDRDTLIRQLGLPTGEATMLLMQMEMQSYISESGGLYRSLI